MSKKKHYEEYELDEFRRRKVGTLDELTQLIDEIIKAHASGIDEICHILQDEALWGFVDFLSTNPGHSDIPAMVAALLRVKALDFSRYYS